MDRDQEEMRSLGICGIYAEACKLIFKCRIIFGLITLLLIVPLSVIFLAEEKVSEILFLKIMRDEDRLYMQNMQMEAGFPNYDKLLKILSLDRAAFILFKAAYFTSVLIFSLLSTAAVVYTVASVYTSREILFEKVMSVVPTVWKRLMVTFLFTFIAFFVYNAVFTYISDFMFDFLGKSENETISTIWNVIYVISLIAYAIGFIYMTIIWLLASVVSVLEDSYGFKALVKSKNLIKGKMCVNAVIFFKLSIFCFVVYGVFIAFVMYSIWMGLGIILRIGLGILCVLLLSKLILFSLVVQTIIYFVCKSYHHENIDKLALSDHLEVYLGDYLPLTKDSAAVACIVFDLYEVLC